MLIELNSEQLQERVVIVPRPLKSGKLQTRDNRNLIADAKSRKMILQKFNERGLNIPVGVGHHNAFDDAARAVGWISELQEEDDQITGKIEWTEEGRELVQSKKFKYLSPEFLKNPATDRIEMIRTAGLVNIPNIHIQELNNEQTKENMALTTEEQKQLTDQAIQISELQAQIQKLQTDKEELEQSLQSEKERHFKDRLQEKIANAKKENLIDEEEEEFFTSSIQSEGTLSRFEKVIEKRKEKLKPPSVDEELKQSLQSEKLTGKPEETKENNSKKFFEESAIEVNINKGN